MFFFSCLLSTSLLKTNKSSGLFAPAPSSSSSPSFLSSTKQWSFPRPAEDAAAVAVRRKNGGEKQRKKKQNEWLDGGGSRCKSSNAPHSRSRSESFCFCASCVLWRPYDVLRALTDSSGSSRRGTAEGLDLAIRAAFARRTAPAAADAATFFPLRPSLVSSLSLALFAAAARSASLFSLSRELSILTASLIYLSLSKKMQLQEAA